MGPHERHCPGAPAHPPAGRPACVQNAFSLLERGDKESVIPTCPDRGIAYSPLGGGWLTGKCRRGHPPPLGSRMALRPQPYLHLNHRRAYDLSEELERRATARGTSMAGFGRAWVLAHPAVSSTVVGPRLPDRSQAVVEAGALTSVAAELAPR
ncbi:MAG: hypothetical protein C4299_03850 [Thermoleophilia bacterium]